MTTRRLIAAVEDLTERVIELEDKVERLTERIEAKPKKRQSDNGHLAESTT